MATEQVYLILFAAVVLVIVFVGLLLLTLRRLRARKAQLITDLQSTPRLNADRAFNRLEMARREAGILDRQGADVGRARELIAQSQAALDLRQFDRAYELAQSAHESLVSVRQGVRPLTSASPASREVPTPASSAGPSSVQGSAPLESTAPPAGLPRNRVESQFAMRMLDSDLGEARARRPSDPAIATAVDLQTQARTAFAAEEYTDAFRYALKGRRELGGNVETVAPGPAVRPPGPTNPADPGAAAERAAGAARCPSCGYPTTPDDAFCRGCGAPRAPTACPRCGAPRTTADTFCGRCGERFS